MVAHALEHATKHFHWLYWCVILSTIEVMTYLVVCYLHLLFPFKILDVLRNVIKTHYGVQLNYVLK